jgi:hypothetical protein
MGPRRDWSDITIEASDPCRICGAEGQTERAHVSGRRFDKPRPGKRIIWVNPLDVIPLCGPATDSQSCHCRFDSGVLDVIGYLTSEEQVRVVENFGSIEQARMRVAPTAYRMERR